MSRGLFLLPVIAAGVAASLYGCGGGGGDTISAQSACEALSGKTIEGGEIVKAQLVAATGTDSPEHCAITGRIAGSSINFEARLPSNWNGKAWMGAGWGWQGVVYAGQSPGGNPSPLSKGYVEYDTDTGHSSSAAETWWDSSFTSDPEALANFAGAAYERTTGAVKGIIKARYGQSAQRTYFEGCSGGGHAALVMAQKYPRLFDGIVAGAPGANWIGTFLGWQRPIQALAVPGALPSQGKLATLSKAILQQCDKLDGVEDGLVSNPLACSFDPEPLRCNGADSDSCLTDPQMNLVKQMTADTVFRDGSLLVKGSRLVGHEDADWPDWISPPSAGGFSEFYLGTGSMVKFLTRNQNADPLTYSVLDDAVNIKNLGSLMDTWPGDLSEFGAAGGKLIVWNGTSDRAVPFENQILYYNSVVASLGGAANAQQSVRAYFPPGVNHCGGGSGADQFDYLDALDRWVTANESPDGKKIAKVVNGVEALSRPLCPYPTWPRYNGSGNPNAASSFSCVAGP